LHLRFDLGGTDLVYRQQAELLVKDLNGIGIDLEPILNNRPRFFDKLQRGDVQLFRVSWVGDYPDAQNFLQLFYGPNAGSCNRTCYRNPDFDRLYEQAIALPDSPERTALYRQLQAIVTRDCAWLFEGYPLTHRLVQPWIIGYIPHHFAYDAWKYLDVDPQQRTDRQRGLKPVRFQSRSHVSRQP
jgi:ABC-type oligopeptide transport system substrate-binding subunit